MMKKLWQGLAVLCLLVSVTSVWYAIDSSLSAGRLEGPSGLIVLPDAAEVWIGVNDELWRTDRNGHLMGKTPFAAVGLPGRPASFVRHPSGRVVAQVRDDPTLYFIDPSTRRVVSRLVPQWPEELARHGGRAVNLAFHADGRLAIATGGGHAVALFDTAGRFLARTGTGAYEFTNGLWWVGDALWTTDTNRFQLKRLDGKTLAVEQAVPLGGTGGFLGPARVRPGAGAGPGPMAALVRFRTDMIAGHVVVLDATDHDGAELYAEGMEPMDLDWLDGDVLVTDAHAQAIRRWSADGATRANFGDAELRSRLADVTRKKASLRRQHRGALAFAIVAFIVGALFAVLADRRKRSKRQASYPIDLSRLGTPKVSLWLKAWLAARAAAWLTGPLFALIAVATIVPRLPLLDVVKLALLFVLMLSTAATPWLLRATTRRLARQPEFEPLFNHHAVTLLTHSKVLGPILGPDEPPLETALLLHGLGRWLVLTPKRLLVFEVNALDQTLAVDVPLRQVAAASTERGAVGGKGSRALSWLTLFAFEGWLEIRLRDGSLISGTTVVPSTAQRIAAHLRAAGALPIAPSIDEPVEERDGDAARTALASALVPGLGQWRQGRFGSALMMFLPWALLMLLAEIPLLWALLGPRRGVHPDDALYVASLHLLMASLAALDAWRMAPRRR
ncbi:MAG TPA: hypothetical protein VLI72_01445 [Methylibium sp.]|nr:hypothetical protein [Methylibium sp.]